MIRTGCFGGDSFAADSSGKPASAASAASTVVHSQLSSESGGSGAYATRRSAPISARRASRAAKGHPPIPTTKGKKVKEGEPPHEAVATIVVARCGLSGVHATCVDITQPRWRQDKICTASLLTRGGATIYGRTREV